jgi:hydrogenase-4 component F
MNEALLPTVTGLPVVAVVVPFAAAALLLLGKRFGLRAWQALSLLATAGTLAIGVGMASQVLDGTVLVSSRNQLRVDALSALMVVLIGAIGLVAALYSLRYIARTSPGHGGHLAAATAASEGVAEPERTRARLWVFYWLLTAFLGAMVWACVTNNLIGLFVAVEATTLASGLLVAFYWDRRALEAGYKYLMLLTVGIAMALFGCVLLYAGAAATGEIGGGDALLISEVRDVVHLIRPGTAVFAVAFLVVGFGTKAGLVPFHPWLPDAHAEAPTPISVLLSGVMIKVAAYALARTVNIFFPEWPPVSTFMVALGALTMLIGIALALRQDDLKRLLAYHSVSQMGYVVAGIGLGTYLGIYGGLFHLVNHTVFKSLLFLCAGALIYATGGLRRISQMSGLARLMPITALCFFVGAFAMGGMPPFNGFMSKLTLFLAFAENGMMWAAVIAVVTSLLTLVCLVHAAYKVFWGKVALAEETSENPGPKRPGPREVPVSMWAGMIVLAGLTLLFGVYPQVLYPILDGATRCILHVMPG